MLTETANGDDSAPVAAPSQGALLMPIVKVFALSTCSHCKNAKRLLDENQVSYDTIEVDLCPLDQREKVLDEVRQYNPSLSFPTLIIGEKVIVGFRENEIKEALGL